MAELEHAANESFSPRPTPRSSGIKLVLPPLNAIKGLKGKKKGGKASAGWGEPSPVQKVPRPLKLKPLKEVLTRLIGQIKKKDDYAFFLQPVDTAQVPGYSDVVKNPMDFGTITQKVEKGKYRSLEEFTSDVRLVTGNAKAFNPPGTIYHTEADRIEAFALSHINKASAQVIEYEADWNIDIEHEDDRAHTVDVDGYDTRKGTPMGMDADSTRGRSPSIASTPGPLQAGGSRKTAKVSKKQLGMVTESWEDDGHLPGYKDGVGQFPSGSDFAQLMLALKLKNKRYRTKKERLRMERAGPPVAADGSIDYPEMEDPFTVLNVFLPDPPSKPLLTPIYPSQPPKDPSEPPLPGPVNLTPDRPLYQPSISLTRPRPTTTTGTANGKTKPRRRHWVISRSTISRGKGKEKDLEEETIAPWKTPREPHTVDWGAFAVLVDKVAQESHVKDVVAELGSAGKLLEAIKQSVEPKLEEYNLEAKLIPGVVPTTENYWEQRQKQAQDYITDVVYGGIEGLAYVRSLAEFCQRPKDMEFPDGPPTYSALGMPLAQWVGENVVDHVTEGRHRLLREASLRLRSLQSPSRISRNIEFIDPTTSRQVDLSLHAYPYFLRQLYDLQQISTHKLDMASLIQEPNELYLADSVWAGAEVLTEKRKKMEEEREKALQESPEKNAADYLAFAIQSHKEAQQGTAAPVYEEPEVISHALEYSADVISQLSSTISRKRSRSTVEQEDAELRETSVKVEAGGTPQPVEHPTSPMNEDEEEGRMLKKLRLNLLALAKRAPLDTVARLPADLIPEPIRPFVPTLATIPSSSYPSATTSA